MPKEGTIDRLTRLIDQAPFDVHIAQTFRLEEAARAHEALHKHFLGKMALLPAS